MRKNLQRFLLFALILPALAAMAQPANNNCTGSIMLTPGAPGAACTPTTGTTVNATQSQPGCTGDADDDVWYSFVATDNRHIVNVFAFTDMVHQVFSGTCGNLTSLVCSDPNTSLVTGLTVGNTYYIRVHTYGTNQTSFDICVTTPPPPPANDDCSGAVSLVPGAPGAACTSPTTGNTTGASQSQSGCVGIADDDVWYSFVATQSSHNVHISNVGNNSMVHQVFSGSCGSLTSLVCSSQNNSQVSGLTIGNTYYVRIYTALNVAYLSFDICVTTPPLNDNCTGAVALTPGAPGAACTPTSGTTVNATLSQPGCQGTSADDDVWYSFVASGSRHTITISNVSGNTSMYLEVFTGTCGNLLNYECSGTNTISLTGLTMGTTYYFRVHTTLSGNATFEVCVTTPPPPPNDECSAAVALLPGTPGAACSGPTSGTTANATQSLPGCVGNADDDVWYSFMATDNRHIINLTSGTSLVHQVFSGTCGNLTSLVCSGPNTSLVTGLTIGNTYYIRVYTNSFNSQATFDICVTTPPPPPANDNCTGAITLVSAVGPACNTSISGNTVGASQSQPGCTGEADDDVWYSFVATQTIHYIEISNVSGNTDMIHQVFSGNCTTLSSLVCRDPNTSILTGLTVGNTYYIRVYTALYVTYASFDICVTTPPLNDNCTGAITLMPSAPGATCSVPTSGNTFNATQSQPGCMGNADDDVWYSFVATQSTHYVNISNVSQGGGTVVHQVFSGTCPNLSALDCSIQNRTTMTGLIPGNSYYIRVHTFGSGNSATFDICITTGPANDNCVAATTLIPGAQGAGCSAPTSGSTTGATQSLAACTGSADDDVWYSFMATGPSHHVIISNVSNGTDMVHEVFSGTCSGLASLICSDPNTSLLTGLTAGNTYYIRVHTKDFAVEAGFNICITTPNDDCFGAVALTPGEPGAACSASTPGNTAGATQSQAGCVGTADDDVWYSFTATASRHVITLSNVFNGTDMVHQVFSGTCSGLTALVCSDPNSSIVTGLTPGATYFIRVYTYNSAVNATFNICVTTPPANDDCAGAIVLTPGAPGEACSGPASGSTLAATPSQAGCVGDADDDVWYSFVATASRHIVTISNVTGFAPDMVHQTFSGTCVGLTSLVCSDPNMSVLNNLTVGNTYYVRVHTLATGFTANFEICITTLFENDNCIGATPLVPANTLSYVSKTTFLATPDSGPGVCTTASSGAAVNAVWFSFVQPASYTSMNVQVDGDPGFDAVLNVINACGMAEIPTGGGCTDASGDGGIESRTLTNLTPGNTYFIQVHDYEGDVLASSTFGISIFNLALPIELTSFTGKNTGEFNTLTWKTASEKNVRWHVIERSEEGILWSELGRVAGQTNSQVEQEYHFVDRAPLPRAYYRLRSVDFDESFSLSNAILLTRKWDQSGIINVYPSPATEWVTVEFGTEQESEVQLFLTDVSGRILVEKTVEAGTGLNQTTFALDNIPPGLYFIIMSNGTVTSSPMRLVRK